MEIAVADSSLLVTLAGAVVGRFVTNARCVAFVAAEQKSVESAQVASTVFMWRDQVCFKLVE